MLPLIATPMNKVKITPSNARVFHVRCCSVMLWKSSGTVLFSRAGKWAAVEMLMLILDVVPSMFALYSLQHSAS